MLILKISILPNGNETWRGSEMSVIKLHTLNRSRESGAKGSVVISKPAINKKGLHRRATDQVAQAVGLSTWRET